MIKTLFSLYQKAPKWDRLYIYSRLKFFSGYFQKIDELMPKIGRLADLGSGYGLLANLLAVNSVKRMVTGIDGDGERIRIAQETIGSRANINFITEKVSNVTFGASEYDGLVMTDFLHHLTYSEQEEIMKKVSQSMKPGGVLVIGDVKESPKWKYYISYLADLVLYIGKPKCFYRRSGEMKKFMEKYGFSVRTIPADQKNIFSMVIYAARKDKSS